MKTTILCILFACFLHLAQAQDLRKTARSVVKSSRSHKVFQVRYLKLMKFQSGEDTLRDTVTALVQRDKKGKLQALRAHVRRSNGYHISTAFDGQYLVFHNRYDTTFNEQSVREKGEQVRKNAAVNAYPPLNPKSDFLKGYQLLETKGKESVFEYRDSSTEPNLGFGIKSRVRQTLDLQMGIVTSEESWFEFEGGIQYGLLQLINIRDTVLDVRKEAISDAAAYRKLPNSDSIWARKKETYVLLEKNQSMPAFGGRLHGAEDSLFITSDDTGIYVLDFFYTTCGPCSAAVPELKKLDSAYRARGVRVIGIDPIQSDWSRLPKYKTYHRMEYPLLKTTRAVPKAFGVSAYPTLFIVKGGRIRLVHVGFGKGLYLFLSKELDTILAE